MNNFQRISTGTDFTPLILAYKHRPELWMADTYLRSIPQGPFGEVQSIMLRFPEKREGEPYDEHESFVQPPWHTLVEAHDVIFNLMHYVRATRLGRCFVNKICPGGQVFPHADTPAHANYWDRFHVVLESAPGVNFRCGDEHVYMAPGEIWWFQNKHEHHVVNSSKSDRVHMILDLRLSQ